MRQFFPGGDLSPLPEATTAQKRLSRAAFNLVSTGSTLNRETFRTVQAAAELPLATVDETTGADVDPAHEVVGSQFEAAEAFSNRTEDRVLTAMVSTSQLAAEYAAFVDSSVDEVVPGSRELN